MISRRQFLGSTALAAFAPSILTSRVFARARQVQQTPMQFTDLRGGVGIFTGRGGTIGWLVSDDSAVAVDSQYPDTAMTCVTGLKDRAPKGIQYLINTHHHGDHTAGNISFRKSVVHIVQQERCAKYHRDTTTATAAEQAYGDLMFGTSWSAVVGSEKVSAKYYGAGHTGGDAVITFEKANVVHMGDLMFNRMHPFIDRPNGASIQSWVSVLGKVAAEHKDAVFIFGHAKPGLPVTGTSADLITFRDYLSAVLDTAQAGIRAGKKPAEIAATPSLPGFEDFGANGTRLSLAGSLSVAVEELSAVPVKK